MAELVFPISLGLEPKIFPHITVFLYGKEFRTISLHITFLKETAKKKKKKTSPMRLIVFDLGEREV